MRSHHLVLGLAALALLMMSAPASASVRGWTLVRCQFKVPTTARHVVEAAELPGFIESLPAGSKATSRRSSDRYLEVTVAAPIGATFQGGMVSGRCGRSEYVVVDGAAPREPGPKLGEARLLDDGSVVLVWADDRNVLSWTRVDWGHSRKELRHKVRGDAELSTGNRAMFETTRAFDRIFVRLQRSYPDGSDDVWNGCLVKQPDGKLAIRAGRCAGRRAR